MAYQISGIQQCLTLLEMANTVILSFIVMSYITSMSRKHRVNLERMKVSSLLLAVIGSVLFCYSLFEIYHASQSTASYEWEALRLRMSGSYAGIYIGRYIALFLLLLLFIPKLRASHIYLLAASGFALIFGSSFSEKFFITIF